LDSDWLELPQISDMLDQARAGARQRLDAYLAESRLRCASPDCSSLVAVRLHHAYVVDDEGWADLNAPPEPDGHSRQVIVLFQRTEYGIGESKLPVPFARRIVEVAWQEERWVFRLEDGEGVRATPLQLVRAMSDSLFRGFHQPEAAIARNFGKIDGSVPIEHLGPPVDWAAIRAKLPPTIEDTVLGVLTRGSEGMDFGTTIVAHGRSVSISVSVDVQGSWETALRRAAGVVGRLDAYVARAKEHAVRELLDLENGGWLTDGEPSVSAEAFQRLMGLEGLTFYDDGSVVLHFEDGESAERSGLFWGHAIVVVMGSDDQFTAAQIEG
jgi:hypothetical protein